MNLTPRWVQCFSGANHYAVHWSESGTANAVDSIICAYAREHEFVLVTNDLDFPQILAFTKRAKPSVILLRDEPLVPEVRGEAVLRAVETCSADLEAGAILSLDCSGKPRACLLPLR